MLIKVGVVSLCTLRKLSPLRRRTDLANTTVKCIWLEIRCINSSPIFLCTTFYGSVIESFWGNEGNSLVTKHDIHRLGRFTVNLLEDDTTSRNWTQVFNHHGMTQLITDPTRIYRNSSTLIDHAYASNNDYIREAKVVRITQFVLFTRRNHQLSNSIVPLDTADLQIWWKLFSWGSIKNTMEYYR